jgi:hypothetical protein
MPPEIVEKIRPRDQPLDRDIAFILGETEMPLSVYESPLMYYYRRFRQMKKNNDSDGYYVVQKRRITSRSPHQRKIPLENILTIDHSVDNFVSGQEDNDYNDNEVMLLYGRGPIFEMHDEYSDRFEGFDD